MPNIIADISKRFHSQKNFLIGNKTRFSLLYYLCKICKKESIMPNIITDTSIHFNSQKNFLIGNESRFCVLY
jgi:hypothetical protein